MSEKRFVQCEIEYGFANTTNIKKIDGIFDMQEEKTYRIEQIVDKLNEQQATIERMNKKIKKQCNHKKAILDFLKFMKMDNLLMEIMIDEFLEEVYDGENYE